MSCGAIPIPVSETEACANPSRDATLTRIQPPLGVYFAALSIRIKSARRSASASAWMAMELSGTSMLNPTSRLREAFALLSGSPNYGAGIDWHAIQHFFSRIRASQKHQAVYALRGTRDSIHVSQCPPADLVPAGRAAINSSGAEKARMTRNRYNAC